MFKIYSASLLLFFLPFIASAQDVQTFIETILIFVNETLINFLLGIGFLFVVINVIRFFILGSTITTGEDSKKKTIKGDRGAAKALALHSVFAFVLIIVFWGLINLLASSIGLEDCDPLESDYITYKLNGPDLPPDCN